MLRKLVAAAFFVVAPVASVAGQGSEVKNVLSMQPLSFVFGFYSGEYERAASKSVTWGIGGNHWSAGDGSDKVDYNSGEFKLRYYPEAKALHGFSFGGAVGFASVTGASGSSGTRKSVGGPSVGVLLEYQWLLGAEKNFAIALGLGAKALSISDDEFSSSDYTAKYPTMRISVGWAY